VTLLGQAEVKALPDGEIQMPGDPPTKMREVGPYVWEAVDKPEQKVAAEVKDGKVVHLSAGWLMPVPGYLNAAWNLPLFLASLCLLALVVAAWPLSALARRRYGSSFGLTGREAGLYRLTRLAAIACLLCIGCWFAVLMTVQADLTKLNDGLDPMIRTAQVFGLLSLVGVVVALMNLGAVWGGARSWFAKLSSLLVAVAVIDIAWIIINFHLLTLSTRF
jgi:hypothetical protein